ncbi:hypothetical protein [Streptomyces rubradiris]|uniref:hypothetical protein n=1 Tax=Streptomyces rubradiris TaxID=285531 RepID=UPI003F4CE9FA
MFTGQPEVVAGADRPDRPVRWVHVAEAADAGARARFVGEVASDTEPEPVVRDPDPATLHEVRSRRQFHRDRAPGPTSR